MQLVLLLGCTASAVVLQGVPAGTGTHKCLPMVNDAKIASANILSTVNGGDALDCQSNCENNPECVCWGFKANWAVPACFLHGKPDHLIPGNWEPGTYAGMCPTTPAPVS